MVSSSIAVIEADALGTPKEKDVNMVWGFVTCGPNEALVISGCCHKKPLLVPGGRAFVWPTVQQVQRYKMSRLVFFPLASLLTSPLFTKPVFDSCQLPCKKELRYLHTEPPFERVCVGGFVMVF
ncbi:uncharacterized protein LOC122267328 [Penaeus japonicus]|uniref:uncharacterized protein LOC122266661 n=1 Tax=Penaeus japonicus TaxID=27405 RepID=UPI001C70D46D|nr:uncharacterized protein LOC122266661 [Penaeus japonicus]XP_042893307.1 uncharacterized protein LOC122267328 [Penaeus japonicus]